MVCHYAWPKKTLKVILGIKFERSISLFRKLFVTHHAHCSDVDELTFSVRYFPLLCSSRRLVNDGEAERPTVLGSVQILGSDVHVWLVLTDAAH